MVRFLITATIGVAMISAAHAQNSSNSMSPSSSSAQNSWGTQRAQNIPQEIKEKLSQDGFTNVQVVPGSYLVGAKDKNGDPVTMVIGPHSMTIMGEFPSSTGTATTGSSSRSSGVSNGGSTSSSGSMKQ